ncbi:MAG TPA: radical SAM protein [Candidatus Omnitrophota bacterium]|nr:radical SAM protein [Candidatus Omnitrophota bacterium]
MEKRAGETSFAVNAPVRLFKRLQLYLVKPSKYDTDGYVIRHWKGVLPSNTLACLYGLSEDVRKRGVLGRQLDWRIEALDDTVQKIDVRKILRQSRGKHTKTIVCIVGVQSNQFPRAADLALAFRKGGVDVLLGGFHVSGILATLHELSPEIAALKDAGVTIVAGEAEGRWEAILQDAMNGSLQPVYNFLKEPPDFSSSPMPILPRNLVNRYAVRHFTTLDCGRGCPFKCNFCTVINVQGRKMRFREVDGIIEQIRENYYKHKIANYFFTDDNLARNKNWRELFDRLIQLRKEEGIHLSFMMQVDTQSHKIPDFIEKAGAAGCSQAFIGMESINEENLKAAGKSQNNIEEYKHLIDLYREAGIATHLAYIIGFPFDSVESVRKDVEKLKMLGAAQASFFMLTPLPGSMDYKYFISNKVMMDADLNNFDSFHETFRHSRMNPREWTQAYKDAWKDFYGLENMKRILRNAPPSKYWGVLQNFIWYKNAIQVEGEHPMLNGFFRLKERTERRVGYPIESRWVYFKRRFRDVTQALAGWLRLAFEMEEVWLATRRRTPLEERVISELAQLQKRVTEWRSLRLSELQEIYRKAAASLAESSTRVKAATRISIPTRFQLWLKKWDVFFDSLTFSRLPMKRFWDDVFSRLKQGRIYEIRFHKIFFRGIQEIVLLVKFIFSFLTQPGTSRLKD